MSLTWPKKASYCFQQQQQHQVYVKRPDNAEVLKDGGYLSTYLPIYQCTHVYWYIYHTTNWLLLTKFKEFKGICHILSVFLLWLHLIALHQSLFLLFCPQLKMSGPCASCQDRRPTSRVWSEPQRRCMLAVRKSVKLKNSLKWVLEIWQGIPDRHSVTPYRFSFAALQFSSGRFHRRERMITTDACTAKAYRDVV